MYLATESGRSESRPFVIDDYFLRLLSLEEHQWRITPHHNASVPYFQLYEYDANVYGSMQTADDTPRIPVHAA